MIITKKLIEKAIELMVPTAEKILDDPDLIWGPNWVEGVIFVPGHLGDIHTPFTFGTPKKWNPAWGEELNFSSVAMDKCEVAKRLGGNTGEIIATRPWLLRNGEYLYAGGVSRDGISVAISGALGRTDEALAEMLINTVIMLAHVETDRRKKADQMKV